MIEDSKTKCIAVDIDEVLSQTALCWIDIVNKKFGNLEKLSSAELFSKYKLTRNIPGWQKGEINDLLESMRVNNEFYENIPVIDGSVNFLNEIEKIIPVGCYLTTRPKNIFEGTKRWLKSNGFPEKEILMRPNEISTDKGNEWKAKILTSLYPNVIGIIDDNPELIGLLPETYKGIVFLYGHEKYANDKINVIPCKNWEKVFKEIKNIILKNIL